jgi:hypothetical protein
MHKFAFTISRRILKGAWLLWPSPSLAQRASHNKGRPTVIELMPSHFPLLWTPEKQVEYGISQSDGWPGLYVMPDGEHRIAPRVIAALTSLIHDGQSAADYRHSRGKDNH